MRLWLVLGLLLAAQTTLALPLNNSVIAENRPSFTWTFADDASLNYSLIIDDSPLFTLPIHSSIGGIQNTSYIMQSNLSDGLYYWKIEVYNNGILNETLPVNSFRVDTAAPIFSSWQESPSIIYHHHEDDFELNVTITDASLATSQCRYRFDTTSFSILEDMQLSGGKYAFTIAAVWENFAGQNLTYECIAIDLAGNVANQTRTKQVIANSNAPSLLAPYSFDATEDEMFNITLSAQDADSLDISFSCNRSDFTLAKLDATSASITFMPDNDDVGMISLQIIMSDGVNTASQDITIDVDGMNDAPVLGEIGNLHAYVHKPFSFHLTASDPDNENSVTTDDNMIFSFSADDHAWIRMPLQYFNGSRFEAMINFTPLTGHKGVHNVTIRVTDSIASDFENFILDVGYCGDKDQDGEPKCDAIYEDCETCPEDCGKCEVADSDTMAILTDERNCLGRNFTMSVYKLFERASCDVEGTIFDGKEVCEAMGGATIYVYRLSGRTWEKQDEFITDEDGRVSFVPIDSGNYKLEAKYRNYQDAYKLLEFKDCIDTPKPETQNQTIEVEAEPQKPRNETKPREERPDDLIEDVEIPEGSVYSILIFYVAIPVFLVGLMVVIYVYYEKEKNNKPWLLKSRIWIHKMKNEVRMAIYPIFSKIKDKLGF